jgi:hypothetical protein
MAPKFDKKFFEELEGMAKDLLPGTAPRFHKNLLPGMLKAC